MNVTTTIGEVVITASAELDQNGRLHISTEQQVAIDSAHAALAEETAEIEPTPPPESTSASSTSSAQGMSWSCFNPWGVNAELTEVAGTLDTALLNAAIGAAVSASIDSSDCQVRVGADGVATCA